MTILGIDWGEKRIGLAFSSGRTAAPLEIIKIKNQKEGLEKMAGICNQLEAEKIVLGVPLNSDGEETIQSQKVKEFGKQLQTLTAKKIVFWNESLSSKEALEIKIAAGRGKKARRNLDATSAAITLQSYLDAVLEKKEDPAIIP